MTKRVSKDKQAAHESRSSVQSKKTSAPNLKVEALVTDEQIADVRLSWKKERPDIDLTNFLVGVHIVQMGRIIDTAYHNLCRANFGISGSEMRMLFALRRAGKPYCRRPTDLFKSLLLTSGAVTKQVNRLIKQKLVERLPDPTYAAGFLIHLTPRGLKVADEAADVLTEHSVLTHAMRSFSPAERLQVEQLCRRLLHELESAFQHEA
jgi:DNA-binding MarR family transcriptional regulator